MAFIGNNPKSKSITLTPQSADIATPAEGMLAVSDGTARAAGLWEYRSSSWQKLALLSEASSDSSIALTNLGFDVTVGSSAATIALKQKNGSSDATGGSPINIAFRSSTLADAAYSLISITGAISLVVPSGATLGSISGAAQKHYVYALNNSGTVELAVSGILYDDSILQSTSAIGTGSDSISGLYSSSARSNVAIRVLGYFISTQTTAGDWSSLPTSMSVIPATIAASEVVACEAYLLAAQNTVNPNNSAAKINLTAAVNDTHAGLDTANNRYIAPTAGWYDIHANITFDGTNVLTNRYDAMIYKNGTAISISAFALTVSYFSTIQTHHLTYLNAGDYLELWVYGGGDNSTNNLHAYPGPAYTYLHIIKR